MPGKEIETYKSALILESLRFIAAFLVIIVFSFPVFDPYFDKGIDESLIWAYNYLFDGHQFLGKQMLFPHGPLAFVMYPLPLGNNLIFAALFDTVLKFIFCFVFYKEYRKNENRYLYLLFTLPLFLIINTQLLIIGTLMMLSMYSIKNKNLYSAVLAVLIGPLAIYIKSYVGIISALLCSFLIICIFINKKSIRKAVLLAAVFLLAYPMYRILIYGDLNGFAYYLYGVKELASDNSAAASYYPKNNWILLIISILSFALIPLFDRSRLFLSFYFISLLATFAAWKHAMARQDIYHSKGLFLFLLMFFFVLFVFAEKKRLRTIFLSIVCISTYYMNLPNVKLFQELNTDVFRVNYFHEFVFNHKVYKDSYLQRSYKNIASQKLDSEFLQTIGDKTIDIYPWDYSYIPANNLNWQPRPILHSYAAYTSWLDKMENNHFQSDKAPQFILWELEKKSKDVYGGRMEGVDYRYLLNDEPQTVLSIIQNYSLKFKNSKYLLLEQREKVLKTESKIVKKEKTAFNKMVEVPETENRTLLRCRLGINKSFSGKIQSFVLKDQESFVTYFLKDKTAYTFKIVPKNAKDGIWVSPFQMHPETGEHEPPVTHIMFSSSNPDFYSSDIGIEWEQIQFEKTEDDILFIGNEMRFDSIFTEFYFNNDKSENNWAEGGPDIDTHKFLKSNNTEITQGGYSKAFKIPTDSLLALADRSLIFTKINFWQKMPEVTDAILVYSVDQNAKNLNWAGEPLSRFRVNERNWNPVAVSKDLKSDILQKGAVLSIYIWNNGKQPLYIDSFRIQFCFKKEENE